MLMGPQLLQLTLRWALFGGHAPFVNLYFRGVAWYGNIHQAYMGYKPPNRLDNRGIHGGRFQWNELLGAQCEPSAGVMVA